MSKVQAKFHINPHKLHVKIRLTLRMTKSDEVRQIFTLSKH